MSGGESSGEKVFDPTPQKLAEARRKGDVPRSSDVTAAATYLALLVVISTGGAFAVSQAASTLMIFIGQPDRLMGRILGPGGPRLGGAIFAEALAALAPVFLLPIAAVLVSLFAQQAIVFSGEKIVPKLDRISPLAGAKRKFGAAGLVEFAKAATKLAAVATALFVYLSRDLDRMIGAATAEARVIGAMLAESLGVLLTVATIIAVAIGAVDFVWQRFEHARRLRMSYQDLREETKQSEGDPHMKAQRRSRAEAIATNRMLLDVPKADVVIVNPTHFAVALKWSRAKGTAPVCVAKGEGEVALRIREVAETAGIPLHSDPPTARALFATVEIGREIAPEHYRAVAAAIRFAERMRRAARARSGG
ncbi:flagellar biosynthesis protein FlhB [Amaricoccus sp.]|uniref:EscU/YscU/HrcU family type III secretion system export apparatus switch protein n=1 Tax=Amaricoccus sp. TaxID=1872485 RepID=UPI00260E2E7F|nr:flagellar type III secretion system protein FlhB [Amaricoccus sp.]HRO10633.1 flagellar type III secretion system protein FlhB [Amaricoccus sp.]